MKRITVGHIVLILLSIGAGQLVAGVYLLAGIGWAVIAMGFITVLFAMIVARGLSNA